MRLHHVQLAMPAGEEDAARAWFSGVLGLSEIDKPPVLAARGGCWFTAGELELHLGVADPFVPATKAHPGIMVDDIDELAGRIADAGGRVTWDDNVPGQRRFHTDDCFGNRLEFLQLVPRAPA